MTNSGIWLNNLNNLNIKNIKEQLRSLEIVEHCTEYRNIMWFSPKGT